MKKWILCVLCTMCRANVIIYITDDFALNDLIGPYLKLLINDGTILDSYSGALCSPSRFSMLTGTSLDRIPYRDNGLDNLINIPKFETLPRMFKRLNYKTAIIGKYGHGNSYKEMGFDSFFGHALHDEAHYFFPKFIWSNTSLIKINKETSFNLCTTLKKCIYGPDLFREKARDYITNNNKFFLWYATTLPHAGYYDKNSRITYPVEQLAGPRKWNRHQRGLKSMYSYIDKDIEMLTSTMTNDTLLIFTSDNGPENLYNLNNFFKLTGPLRGFKRSMYEGAIRVPTVLYQKNRKKKNITVKFSLHNLKDLLETYIQTGKFQKIKEDYIISEYCPKNLEMNCKFAIIKNFNAYMKLLNDSNKLELYNLTHDISEKINLINNKLYGGIIDDLLNYRKKHRIPL